MESAIDNLLEDIAKIIVHKKKVDDLVSDIKMRLVELKGKGNIRFGRGYTIGFKLKGDTNFNEEFPEV